MTAEVDYYDPGTPDSTFTYKDAAGIPDPLGRLLSRTDPIGTTTYSYKPLTAVNGARQLDEQMVRPTRCHVSLEDLKINRLASSRPTDLQDLEDLP